MKKAIILIPYFILIFSIFWFVSNHSEKVLEIWESFSANDISILVSLQFCAVFFLSYPITIFFRTHNLYTKLFDIIFLTYACNFFNHLVPYRPGVALRWWYLKKHYSVSSTLFFSVMSVYFVWLVLAAIITFIITAVFLNIPLNIIFQQFKFPAFTLLIVLLFMVLLWTKIRHYPYFENIVQTLKLISKANTCQLIASTLIFYMLMGVTLMICFEKIGHAIPLHAALFFLCTLKLTSIIQITPGNAGIAEVAVGALTQWLYQDFTIGFSAIAIFRITQLTASGMATVILGPIAYRLKKIVPG